MVDGIEISSGGPGIFEERLLSRFYGKRKFCIVDIFSNVTGKAQDLGLSIIRKIDLPLRRELLRPLKSTLFFQHKRTRDRIKLEERIGVHLHQMKGINRDAGTGTYTAFLTVRDAKKAGSMKQE